jgi:hypothetical protein
MHSGPIVHLEIAKKAAQMNGIAPYLQNNGYSPSQQTEIKQNRGNGQTANLGRFNSQPQIHQNGKTKTNGRPTSASELNFHQQPTNNDQMMNPTATMAANGGSLRNPGRHIIIYIFNYNGIYININ